MLIEDKSGPEAKTEDAKRKRYKTLSMVLAIASLVLSLLRLNLWWHQSHLKPVTYGNVPTPASSTTLPPGCPYEGAALAACGTHSGTATTTTTTAIPTTKPLR